MKNENIIYLVLSNLNHDGTHYQKGAFIEGDYSPTYINLVRDGVLEEILGASTASEAKKIIETENANTPEEEPTETVTPENTWGPKSDEPEEVTPEVKQLEHKVYKITGDAFFTDENGVRQGEPLEIGSIQNLHPDVGQIFVDGGVAEEVTEETKGEEVVTPENKSPEVTGENL